MTDDFSIAPPQPVGEGDELRCDCLRLPSGSELTGKRGLAFRCRPLHSLRRGGPRRHVDVVPFIRELQHDLMVEHIVLRAKADRIATVFEIPRLPGIRRPFAFGPEIRQRQRILNQYLHIMVARKCENFPPPVEFQSGMREPGTSFSENGLTSEISNRVSAY